MTTELIGRRPLRARRTGCARWVAGRVAGRATPNQISAAGLVAGLFAGALFVAVPWTQDAMRQVVLIGAAGLILLRLLCNMLDGMVAVEGAKGSPTGPLWNEVPDRLADVAVLAGAGVACGAPVLGWAAASLALFTAYLRVLGEQMAGLSDFSGPMAKPHRMAALIGAALAASAWPWQAAPILQAALWVVVVGTAVTAGRRLWRLGAALSTAASPRHSRPGG